MALADNFRGDVWAGHEPAENCNRAGAEALAERIETYWRERGHIVHCRIEPKGFTSALRAARFDVRSDMISGLPRACAGPALPSPENDNDLR